MTEHDTRADPPSVGESGIEQSGIEQSGIEQSGIEQSGVDEASDQTSPEPTSAAAQQPKPSGARRLGAGVGLLALVAAAVFGGNVDGIREQLLGSAVAPPAQPALSRNAGTAVTTPVKPASTSLRSQPWWQTVRTLAGTGTTTASTFTIAHTALQWRVRWSCQSGHLRVQAGAAKPLVDAACPGNAAGNAGYATRTGTKTLHVTASGPWQLTVEQQVDVPLDEPPLPAMTAPGAVVASTGSFYRIDQVGTGKVSIYRLADGSHALRLSGFYVTPNVDLLVTLSPLPAPHSTDAFVAARFAKVTDLDVTAGSLNFTVPKGVDVTAYRSVVIWCEQLHSAYAAASLTPAG